MTVPDHLAGKRGKCSKCKGPVLVPQPNLSTNARTSSEAPVDLEAAAVAVLSDAPLTETKQPTLIEFNCPQCDEPLKLSLDLAGKRHPCPECRRIIQVPVPKTQDPSNWRDTGPKLPTGAKRPDLPALEGAWGSQTSTRATHEALQEAGVIKEKAKPLTLYQRLQPYLLLGTPLLLVLAGGYYLWSRFAHNQEKKALHYALSVAASPEAKKSLGNAGVMALHGYAGLYYRNSQTPDAAEFAQQQYSAAVGLGREVRDWASDALLAEFTVALLELAGQGPEVESRRKLDWKETHKLLRAALQAIDSQPGRLWALPPVTAGLLQHGQVDRALPLVATLYPTPGADRAEAFAVVGLELLRLERNEEAQQALSEALAPYADKKAPPLLKHPVVTLALLLGKNPPAPGMSLEDNENHLIGQAEAAARQGKQDEAKALASQVPVPGGGNARAWIALAVGAVEAKKQSEAVSAALDAIKSAEKRPDLSWPLLRLLRAGLSAGVSPETLEPAVASLADPGLADWGKLLLWRARLASLSGLDSLENLKSLGERSLAGQVARLELARHNTRHDRSWATTVQSWDEPLRALGSLGVALGMQGSP